MQGAGLSAWFQPTIDIQAPGQTYLDTENPRTTILPGDLLHCDMGFHYLGLATDQQQHAYVLRPGETDEPPGLRAALADGNRLQDIHLEEMQVGRSGNDVLSAAPWIGRRMTASVRRFTRIRLAFMATPLVRSLACGIVRMACRASAIIRYTMTRSTPSN